MNEVEPVYIYIENGIIIGKYNLEYVDINHAKNIVFKRKEIAKGKPYPILSDIRSVIAFDKDSKEYFATEESYHNVIAGALLVKSVYQKIVGNFYLYLNKQRIPTKVFTEQPEALKWLGQYVVNKINDQ
jgi:hypothetical protein